MHLGSDDLLALPKMKLEKSPWYFAHTKKVETIEYDHAAIGAELRRRRRQLGLSLRNVAKRMRVSAPYLSDLERGNRPWNGARIGVYELAIQGSLCQRDYQKLVRLVQNQPPTGDFLIGANTKTQPTTSAASDS